MGCQAPACVFVENNRRYVETSWGIGAFCGSMALGAAGLGLLRLFGPCGLDIGQNINDLIIAKRAAKFGHATGEIFNIHRIHHRLAPKFDVLKEKHAVMVPCVACFVMWRGWQDAVFVGRAPVWLPLKVDAVAAGAVFSI